MKIPRPTIGLRGRLCYLSIVVVAALAATLARTIEQGLGATIRASSVALLDQAQPIVAARAVELIAQGDDEGLQKTLQDVVVTDPFEIAACFDLAGRLRGSASRTPLSDDQEGALRRYGVHNTLGSLQRAWQADGIRFFQHPMLDPERGSAPRGVLLLATNRDAVERRVEILRRYLWAAALIGGGIAAIAVLVLARALTRPLLALVKDVRRLEHGLPAVRHATGRRDEIGGLARAFGQMAESVQSGREELRRKGEELAQAVAQRKLTLGRVLKDLRALGARKDAFLSSISHELRTPLTVVQSTAEIVLDGGGGSDAGAVHDVDARALAEFLPGIREQALALDRLVDNLLLMLELERCERVAMPESSTLGALLDAALAEVEPARVRGNVSIRCEVERDRTVRWDVALAVRMLRELVLNAIHFSPPGGTVKVSASIAGARLSLSVLDEGSGIPAEHCEEVFERFHQLGDVMTEKPKGTGLGLPLCRAAAILHGGWIRAERRTSSGACLTLDLPLDASAGPHAVEWTCDPEHPNRLLVK